MQSYSIATLTLLMISGAIIAYAWSPTTVSAPRTAILANAKPTISAEVAAEPQIEVAQAAPAIQQITSRIQPSILPSQFQTLQPEVELASNTTIRGLTFATGVNESYEPVNANSVFGEGDFTLYATFDYADMADGMTWSWVWRHEGTVVGGGEQHWAYGDSGPGWVYFQPEDGFTSGEYSLELWG